MFHNYLAVALRNLMRNRLYAAINIVGLAVGFAAAVLIALFVRDEFSYDKWLPHAERSYLVTSTLFLTGRAPTPGSGTPSELAGWMKLDFPQIESIGRVEPAVVTLKHGDIEETELNFYWADPDFFSIAEFPVVAGDLKTALQRPDGIVLTRSMARKYFQKDAPIGETIEVDHDNVLTVTAVVEDLPSNTHVAFDFIGSGRAMFSKLAQEDNGPHCTDCYELRVATYFRLKPSASINQILDSMGDFIFRHRPGVTQGIPDLAVKFSLVPFPNLHFHREAAWGGRPPGNLSLIYAVSAIGLLIVAVASINFINLMTARASRRAVEVGIRKVFGASKRNLVVQFIGESTLYVLLSMVIAVSLAEVLLPTLNAFLDRSIGFPWWYDASLSGSIVGSVIAVGVLAGVYPALVLSAFKPAEAMKSEIVKGRGSIVLRQILIIVQFAVLIGLIVSTAIIYRQTHYALNEGLRIDTDQALLVGGACNEAFKNEAAKLPGVKPLMTCSSNEALNFGQGGVTVVAPNGTKMVANAAPIDFDFFEFYGLRPLAGRFFSRDRGGDAVPANSKDAFSAPLVINDAARRAFGFASPEAAIGKTITAQYSDDKVHPSEIIGVVDDFSVDAIHQRISATIYFVDASKLTALDLRLAVPQTPEAIRGVKELWRKLGNQKPLKTFFLDHRWRQGLYKDLIQQAKLFSTFAGIALFIACLGLFGLSSFAAERRTKEIGIRKAMGAGNADIVKLLVWQFTKPVLWANLIAWPVGWYLMNRWLHSFAYHVRLEPWIFLAASGAALVIALATVSTHAFLVARAQPVSALRYE